MDFQRSGLSFHGISSLEISLYDTCVAFLDFHKTYKKKDRKLNTNHVLYTENFVGYSLNILIIIL